MNFMLKKTLTAFYTLFLSVLVSSQSWGVEENFIEISDENNSFSVSDTYSDDYSYESLEEWSSEDYFAEFNIEQKKDTNNSLIEGLIQDLDSLNLDAEEYIERHQELKNAYLQSREIYKTILLMREGARSANFGASHLWQGNYRDDSFRSLVTHVPMIMNIYPCTFMMEEDKKEVKLPEGHKIILPTIKPVVEAIKNLNISTEENRINSLDVIDYFIPKMVDVLNHIAMEANRVWELLHKNAQKVDFAQEKMDLIPEK